MGDASSLSCRMTEVAASDGKSRWIEPSSVRLAISVPESVSKWIGAPASVWPASHSACELASVAWPQRSTSSVGVNQRSA